MADQHADRENRFVLDPALLIGVPAIDQEHSELFAVLDTLMDAPFADLRSEAFLAIFGDLGKKIRQHFVTEEAIFRQCGMPAPDVDAHVMAHNRILEECAQFDLDLIANKGLDPSEMLLMINRWLRSHVVNFDLEIKQYLPGGDTA